MFELEVDVEGKLRTQVTRLGGLCLKFVSPGYTGVPDRLILLPGGKVIFAETKQLGKKERGRQEYVQKVFRDMGFTVFSSVDRPERIAEVLVACKEVMADGTV